MPEERQAQRDMPLGKLVKIITPSFLLLVGNDLCHTLDAVNGMGGQFSSRFP